MKSASLQAKAASFVSWGEQKRGSLSAEHLLLQTRNCQVDSKATFLGKGEAATRFVITSCSAAKTRFWTSCFPWIRLYFLKRSEGQVGVKLGWGETLVDPVYIHLCIFWAPCRYELPVSRETLFYCSAYTVFWNQRTREACTWNLHIHLPPRCSLCCISCATVRGQWNLQEGVVPLNVLSLWVRLGCILPRISSL